MLRALGLLFESHSWQTFLVKLSPRRGRHVAFQVSAKPQLTLNALLIQQSGFSEAFIRSADETSTVHWLSLAPAGHPRLARRSPLSLPLCQRTPTTAADFLLPVR